VGIRIPQLALERKEMKYYSYEMEITETTTRKAVVTVVAPQDVTNETLDIMASRLADDRNAWGSADVKVVRNAVKRSEYSVAEL
jgi:hypothetical protein